MLFLNNNATFSNISFIRAITGTINLTWLMNAIYIISIAGLIIVVINIFMLFKLTYSSNSKNKN